MKKAILILSMLVIPGLLSAEEKTANEQSGQFSLGAQYNGWSANTTGAFNGWEIMTPLSFNFGLGKDFRVYGQTEFAAAGYTTPAGTQDLTNISDSVIGGTANFKLFGLKSLLNVGLNLPTGDQSWELKEFASNVPNEFIGTRYRGRGFGVNAMYGFAIPDGKGEYSAGVGYTTSGTYTTGLGSVTQDFRLGDSLFIALNHAQAYTNGETEFFRLSAFYSLPTQTAGVDSFRLGTNFNASYQWSDPRAFSFEIGAQAYLASDRLDSTGKLTAEKNIYYAPRFYVAPGYSFGDLNVTLVGKFILPNGYAAPDPLQDGGGFLAGVLPSYKIGLDETSDLKVTAGYDYILWGNQGNNINYNYWTFGTSYELKL